MKKNKELVRLLLAISAVATISLTGCSTAAGSETTENSNAEASAETKETEDVVADAAEVAEVSETADKSDDEAAAEQLLRDLTGTYQELWPVILADEYRELWQKDCAELVGEENAEAANEKLSSMVTGTVYGEEAVSAYADGNGVYDCSFLEGVSTLEFDGEANRIAGYDAEGNELFAHTYHYVGMEEIRGLYEYESDDADSGEFTYFCIAPDTSETTYHIELRYGSDLDNLGKYAEGPYAYWLGSGITTDYDEEMVENCIQLFCTENLAG